MPLFWSNRVSLLLAILFWVSTLAKLDVNGAETGPGFRWESIIESPEHEKDMGSEEKATSRFLPIDPIVKSLCSETPQLLIDNAAYLVNPNLQVNGEDTILFSSTGGLRTYFLVRHQRLTLRSFRNGDLLGAFDKASAFKMSGPLPPGQGNPLAFLEKSTKRGDGFYAISENADQTSYRVTETTIDKSGDRLIVTGTVDVDVSKWPHGLKEVLAHIRPPQKLVSIAAYDWIWAPDPNPTLTKIPQRYMVAAKDPANKVTTIIRTDGNGVKLDEEEISEPLVALSLHPPNTDKKLMAFINSVKGLTIGSIFLNKFLTRHMFVPVTELLGCPPAPCFTYRATSILELPSGKKRVYFNNWSFDFKEVGQRLDYSTAKKGSSGWYSYYGAEYRYNGFLGVDSITHVIGTGYTTQINRQGTAADTATEPRLSGIQKGDALFARTALDHLFYTSREKTFLRQLIDGSQLANAKNVAFFGFDPFEHIFAVKTVRSYYLEKETIYMLLENMYYAFPMSALKTDNMHIRLENITTQDKTRHCFNGLFGCRRVPSLPDVPNEAQNFPCGGIKQVTGVPEPPPPTAEPTKVATEGTTINSTMDTSSTPSLTPTTGMSIGWIFVVLAVFALIAIVVAGAVFGYMQFEKRSINKEAKRPRLPETKRAALIRKLRKR